VLKTKYRTDFYHSGTYLLSFFIKGGINGKPRTSLINADKIAIKLFVFQKIKNYLKISGNLSLNQSASLD